MEIKKGIGVSPGVVISTAVVLDAEDLAIPERHITPGSTGVEIDRFRKAVDASIAEVQAIRENMAEKAGKEIAGIFDAHVGILRDKSLLKMSDDDFDQVIGVHLRGTFTCVRAAYAYFKEHGVQGRIITIGSPTGQRGNFGQTNYAAAKAGIVGMVRTWALEMARAGVLVNAVVPVAATAMTRTIPYFTAAIEADDAGEPMPDFYRKDLGFGTASDVAGLVVFLASDEAAGINGQVIGAGGDRIQLWSHPEPVLTEFAAGGWTADAIAGQLAPRLVAEAQAVGETFPPLPAELDRSDRSAR